MLVDSSLAIPNVSLGGTPTLRKTVPFSSPFSLAGNKGVESYKYLKLQDKTVTKDEYEKAKEKWLKEKEESNKKPKKNWQNTLNKGFFKKNDGFEGNCRFFNRMMANLEEKCLHFLIGLLKFYVIMNITKT